MRGVLRLPRAAGEASAERAVQDILLLGVRERNDMAWDFWRGSADSKLSIAGCPLRIVSLWRRVDAKATARGVSAEQYALEALEQDLAAATEPQPAQRWFDNLSDLLLNSPFAGANLDLDRSRDQPRTLDPA